MFNQVEGGRVCMLQLSFKRVVDSESVGMNRLKSEYKLIQDARALHVAGIIRVQGNWWWIPSPSIRGS